jgi:hypothetical protein
MSGLHVACDICSEIPDRDRARRADVIRQRAICARLHTSDAINADHYVG